MQAEQGSPRGSGGPRTAEPEPAADRQDEHPEPEPGAGAGRPALIESARLQAAKLQSARHARQQARQQAGQQQAGLARMLPGSLARVPPELVRGLGTTVHAQIEDWLAGAIAAGQLAAGDRLPPEHDLAEWLGVSRMTLRHALSELAQRGLVTRTVGRHGGTFVAEPKIEQDVTTLAGFSEQLRRYGMVAGARVLAASQIPAGPAVAAALELADGEEVYEVRRLRLADGRPMVLEHSQFPARLFPGLLDCRLDGSLYELLAGRFGQRPHRAKESFEPVIAGVRESEALEVEEGAPLMLVERIAYSPAGRPLEFARDLLRGDRTRLVVWTSELAGNL
ncbi:MAG TPA: GntR family transcriptional regulator [Streptosporangiaceae bacterium]|jgi:GntR family transcriptional regulator